MCTCIKQFYKFLKGEYAMNKFEGLSPGELYDRLTILLLKINFQEDGKYFQNELKDILEEIENRKYQISRKLKLRLMFANLQIWELESDIRLGKEKMLSLKEVGKRAIKIREYNNIRWSIKNKINKKYNYHVEKKHAWNKKLPKSVIKDIAKKIESSENIPMDISETSINLFIKHLLGVKNEI